METTKRTIAYIDKQPDTIKEFHELFEDTYNIVDFDNGLRFFSWLSEHPNLDAVVVRSPLGGVNGIQLLRLLKERNDISTTPFLAIIDQIDDSTRKVGLKEGVSDLFDKPIDKAGFILRLNYLIEHPPHRKQLKEKQQEIEGLPVYQMPWAKRLFDILFSGIALLVLSPVLLLLGILIKLESKGPIFYYSHRVGTGYKVFKFYKLRSMRQNADQMLKKLDHLNQYKTAEKPAQEAPRQVSDSSTDSPLLYTDGETLTEEAYRKRKKAEEGATFIKIKDDPRVTRIGRFIRNTSIDELPQLFNVLKGDMSIVGNRPLPLYEAEKITTDQFILRFLAPAGITGLWQVTKRGRGEMSEAERMALDNDYARDYSFGRDIKLIVKTIPALFQKENV